MLDLMMPVMDGYEFLEMYRKRKEYSYLRLAVVRQKTTLREQSLGSVHGILF